MSMQDDLLWNSVKNNKQSDSISDIKNSLIAGMNGKEKGGSGSSTSSNVEKKESVKSSDEEKKSSKAEEQVTISQRADVKKKQDAQEEVIKDIQSNKDMYPDVNKKEAFKREVTHTDTKAQTRPKGRPSSDPVGHNIKNFDKGLMTMISSLLPEAANKKEALEAFVYAHRDRDVEADYSGLSDKVKTLAEHIDRYKVAMEIDRQLSIMVRMLREVIEETNVISLMNEYMIARQFGAVNVGRDVKDLKLENYDKVLNLIDDRVRDSLREIQKRERLKEGRPIR